MNTGCRRFEQKTDREESVIGFLVALWFFQALLITPALKRAQIQ